MSKGGLTADCPLHRILPESSADMVHGLGAHRVMDYTHEDFRHLPEPVDVFFDVFGNCRFPDIRPLLKPNGRFIL